MRIVIPICVSLVSLGIIFLIYYLITVLIELRNTLKNVTKTTALLAEDMERINAVAGNLFEISQKIKTAFSGINPGIMKGIGLVFSIVALLKKKKREAESNVR